ncbi:MAG: PSD1 and planctomycete cytochrome C domain-containing protein [Gemmataceae bacterium]
MPRVLFAAAFLLLPHASASAADDPAAVEFFEKKIRPVLVEHCQKCHDADAEKNKKLKGGLRLDSKAAWMKGGDAGPVIVPGKPSESHLFKTIRYDGDLKMPPKGKLPDNVIADFEKWIKDGAVDPRTDAATTKAPSIDFAKGREFWSLKPPVSRDSKATIDTFIADKWKEKNLAPAAPADKRTLIRRATFDLLGLPPTPEDVDAFLADESPNAFAKLVDKLLASPHYGERWGRHWLDVARYAEDQAHTFGVKPKTNAWIYRDWVVKAFNDDMPFDRFAKIQLAGDLMPESEGDLVTRMSGLGLLGLGADYYKNTAREQAIAEELDDRVDVVSRAFLGLTVSCARCHDHKFDPIPTRDYYSLAGIFYGTNLTDFPIAPKAEVEAYRDAQKKLKAAEDKMKKMQADAKAKPMDKELAAAAKTLATEFEAAKKAMPKEPLAAPVLSGNGQAMKVYIRGNPATKGEDAPKGFLQVIATNPEPKKDFTRLDLANAIATDKNPLTARVIVNRVWAWHFGRGIVATPSNFGKLGDAPSHPELLDWLAVEFVKHGWSIKWLHRQIMNAKVYQLAATGDAKSSDAANVYLWRGTRKRLDIESWRDSLLAISGNLDAKMGGPTFDLKDANAKRRTVYAKVSRHELDGLLRLFDFPDANVTADKRSVTTVPQQQLFTLNSDFMVNQAKAFAARVVKLGDTDEGRIAAAYRLAFNRKPDPRETKLGVAFLKLPAKTDDKLTRWEQYSQALLAGNELLFVD